MLKSLLYFSVLTMSLTACSVSRQATTKGNNPVVRKENKKALRFIQSISVASSDLNLANLQKFTTKNDMAFAAVNPGLYLFHSNIETSSWIQFKYAILMKVAVEELTNMRLLQFIDEWYATKYKYGGTTKKGIDCSAFSLGLITDVYGWNLPRTCRQQYATTQRVKKDELKEGDLVFFNIKHSISHVGVYLTNNKFVHASTSSGVMISDLEDEYFSRRYAGAGRVEEKP